MTRKESAIAHVVASSDYGLRFPVWLFEHLNPSKAGFFEFRQRSREVA
ncbi:MAG: hypothetical protein RBT67_03045 [Thauera sp.]|jgi:hypothetical protein|nr:hypothetical protein [Thauera sp.]